MADEKIGIHQFYDRHISKSLPALFRNGSEGWPLKKVYDFYDTHDSKNHGEGKEVAMIDSLA